MKHSPLLLACLLVAQASAQSTNILSIIASEGSVVISIFTSVTGSLGRTTVTGLASSNFESTTATADVSSALSSNVFSATTAPSTTADLSSTLASISSSLSSASASITSSLSSASSSASAASASAQSSLSSVSSSASAAGASATSAADTSSGNNRDRTLAIVLGTVLGALALGLLILLILILCRRRRRRRAHGRGSISSTSDEALASHKTPGSHVAPLVGRRSSKRKSLLGHNHAAQPLMAERSNYDVPSAHQFGHSDTAPFVPTGPSKRLSGVPLTEPHSGLGTGAGRTGRSLGGHGLNSHPYHDNHHTGSALAAGAGGAALGAAAARHSRSGERHSRSGERNSRSGERHTAPRLSGDADVHPAFWDEPPPRSPHRRSGDSTRRSGSMPRSSFYGPTDKAESPLRNSFSANPTGTGTGIAAAVAADRAGRNNHDRGRSFHTPSPGYSTDTTLAGSQVASHGMPGTHHGAGSAMHTGTPPLPGQAHTHPHHNSAIGPAVVAGAAGAGLAHHSRSRSRSGPGRALPSSLAIGNGNQRRSHPSRSPKRTRFSDGDVQHDPMPYEHGPFRDGAISPPSGNRESWNHMDHPAYRNSGTFEEPISPVSPEDVLRAPSHRTPGTANHNSRFSDPSRTSSVSPQVLPPAGTTTTTTTNTSGPFTHHTRNTLPPRQNSGLVNAVSDHLNPAHRSQQEQNYQPTSYQPFISETIRPSALSNPDTTAIPTSKPPKPYTRKPVPASEYNTARSPSTGPDPGEPRRSGENWWRGEEDLAWEESYAAPSVGQAR